MTHHQPKIDTSPKVSDEVRKTTCYMCACRCGINVHMKDGKVAYIEGNRDHPVNKGVLCAKGSAGIMQVNAPSRLRAPLKRVGPRGSGEFEEISWDEALQIAADWLEPIREENPEKLAFFTGRDQSQSFTSFWAQNFGTPNYAAHGGFCSVNMAAAGIYTMGGAFWEFGQPDWDHTKLFMLFGVAEDHDSNPIKIGIGKIKARGARVIGVNPIRSGYNAVADDWVGITPGTDGLFILSLIHELMKAGKIDLDYLARYTNAPVLVNGDEKSPDYGLFLRDEDGKPLVIDRKTGKLTAFDKPGVRPDLHATHRAAGVTHRPVMHLMAERYLDKQYAPEAVAERCGIKADKIRTIAAELARVAFDEAFELDHEWTDFRGEKHTKMMGRPVSFHSMRGVSAHSNGFQTCRALHVLQIILGTVEVPGGFRFKPPYPKPVSAHPKPHAKVTPGSPLNGPHLGFVQGPDDLVLKEDGSAGRIDKAFTWENPMSSHGLMHMVISNAHAGDPYKIDTLFMYMANMSWNSSMNTKGVMEMLTDTDENGDYVIPRIIYSDAYSSEMVAYSDLILPDTTYLERHDCISLLDRPICEADGAADAIRWPVIEPDRDVRGFQTVLVQLANKMKLPGFTNDDGSAKYEDYADYMVNHERRRVSVRWRAGEWAIRACNTAAAPRTRGSSTATSPMAGSSSNTSPRRRPITNPGTRPIRTGRLEWVSMTARSPISLTSMSRRCASSSWPPRATATASRPIICASGSRRRWTRCRSGTRPSRMTMSIPEFPVHALTQRPMAMYHSWGTQNAWLRQIHGRNPLYVPTKIWEANGFAEGDWARVTSAHGEITVPVAHMAALNENTIWTWNAIGKRKGAWALGEDASEATKGFLLNHLIHELQPPKGDGLRWSNSDPITGQAAWFDLRVKIEKASAPPDLSQPAFDPIKSPVAKGPSELTWKVGK